jgi:hypothetical protein
MTWILTAFIGSFLGYVLIQVLYLISFYPKKSIRIAFWDWQGWIPRWYDQKMTIAVKEIIISLQLGERIRERLLDGKTREAVDQWLTEKVGQYLTNTLPSKWPMISMLIGEKTHEKVKQALSDYLFEHWQTNIESMSQNQLSDAALSKQIDGFLTSADTKNWYAKIEELAAKWKPRLLLISLPLGAGMAVLGKLIHHSLLSL